MSIKNTPVKLSDTELLLYIKTAEEQRTYVPLSQIFMTAIDHPAAIAKNLQKLCDKGFIKISPNQKEALKIIEVQAQKFTHMDGPKWKIADKKLALTSAQHGTPIEEGSYYIEAGTATAAFAYAMTRDISPKERTTLHNCSLNITKAGQTHLDSLKRQGREPTLDCLKPPKA